MRAPNGYGGISVIGGNRRKPFRARITTGWEYNEKTGRQRQKYATLGYYATRKEAMIALAEYNKDPYDIDSTKVTFEEIYMKWFPLASAKMGKSSKAAYSTAFKNLAPLHKQKMRALKKNELQEAINSLADKSESTQNNAKILINAIFRYCIENDILEKDYSQFVTINAPKEVERIHNSYTVEEIKLLWDNLNLPVELRYSAKDIRNIYPVDLILIMIYTGVRPSELLCMRKENVFIDERYMVGGLKTEAGVDRIIPIHDDIYPLMKARYEAAGQWIVPYKSDNPPTLHQYRKFFFDPVMEKLRLNHLPGDGRHTLATFADDAGIKEHYIKLIIGHKIKDITKEVYTHIAPAKLVEEVNKIVFVEK